MYSHNIIILLSIKVMLSTGLNNSRKRYFFKVIGITDRQVFKGRFKEKNLGGSFKARSFTHDSKENIVTFLGRVPSHKAQCSACWE